MPMLPEVDYGLIFAAESPPNRAVMPLSDAGQKFPILTAFSPLHRRLNAIMLRLSGGRS